MFGNDRYDLGVGNYVGYSKDDVDRMLKDTHSTGPICMICGNPAHARLLPTSHKYVTAEIQDKGYVCNHCIKTNPNLDKKHYSFQPLGGK